MKSFFPPYHSMNVLWSNLSLEWDVRSTSDAQFLWQEQPLWWRGRGWGGQSWKVCLSNGIVWVWTRALRMARQLSLYNTTYIPSKSKSKKTQPKSDGIHCSHLFKNLTRTCIEWSMSMWFWREIQAMLWKEKEVVICQFSRWLWFVQNKQE